jgi:arylsulfatase A-like enzyme
MRWRKPAVQRTLLSMRRLLRVLALCLGFPLLGALVLGLAMLGARWAWVSAFPSPPDAPHLEQKAAYLGGLPQVDPARAPSFVVIFFDDLGWGDLSLQGNRLISTPRIDRAAAEGLRMNHFYSASPVCTPSRAALLTGRYPPRTRTDTHVYFPDSMLLGKVRRVLGAPNEIPRDEILLPEALGAAGYATGMIGKWHLGELPGHRPTEFGFDSYFGVHWSNDMYPLHLYRGTKVAEEDRRPAGMLGERDEERPLGPGGIDQSHLTERYTGEAIAFLEANRERPFFLYLAHTFPHVPHYASPAHEGESEGGLYGDVVEDLDRSTGAVLDAIARLGLEERTLVIITSDNGPDYGGSPGGLRGRKGDTYEGGQRVPMVVRWPGQVPADESDAMAMNIDLLPTLLALAGLPLPPDREIDGRDLTGVWRSGAASPHEELFYFPVLSSEPDAVRDQRFKLLGSTGDVGRDRPHLTRLDVGLEAHDLRRKRPEVARRLGAALETKRAGIRENPRGWLE